MCFLRRTLLVTLTLTLLAGAVGCSSEPDERNAANPLDALRASEKTDRYRQTFWEDASDNKPKLFMKAARFCRQHDFDASTYPNCEYVRGPAMLEQTGRSLDSIETEGFSGDWDLGDSAPDSADR